ncbi:MAG: hypothetical protein Q4E99_06680 [Bacillota bacterium]|nr:hypothetical protein [Bacillota bacterium]
MKTIFTIITALIVGLFPELSYAAYCETSEPDFYYNLEQGFFYDDTFSTPLDLSVVPDDIEIYEDRILSLESPDLVSDPALVDFEEAVCEIGGIYYSSIIEAFDALNENKGYTQIFLHQDCYTDVALNIPLGCHVSIIMNESNIIGECNYALISSGDLTVIGAGSISNALGGGIYNAGSGTVRLQNCVNVSTKENCLVNNKDGSIYINEDCSLFSESAKTKKQISYGAGSIVDNSEIEDVSKEESNVNQKPIEETPLPSAPQEDEVKEEKKFNLFSFLPNILKSSHNELEQDPQFRAILNSSTNIFTKAAQLLITPPWIYIIGFILVAALVLIIKTRFLK